MPSNSTTNMNFYFKKSKTYLKDGRRRQCDGDDEDEEEGGGREKRREWVRRQRGFVEGSDTHSKLSLSLCVNAGNTDTHTTVLFLHQGLCLWCSKNEQTSTWSRWVDEIRSACQWIRYGRSSSRKRKRWIMTARIFIIIEILYNKSIIFEL